jgi:hypothetical protein
MAEKTRTIEKIIAEVMEDHLPQMKKEMAQRLAHELGQAKDASDAPAAHNGAAGLLKAIAAIHAGSTQKEILRALLEGTTEFCGRAALFVVKSGAANGWQGRGFENNDAVKDFNLDVNSAAVGELLQARKMVNCGTTEMDTQFVSSFGAPSDDKVLLLPLALKDKIAALIYADAGSSGTLDQSALELLVVATGAWLEVMSMRKHAPKESTTESAHEAHPESRQKTEAYSDPFAAHAPRHTKAAVATAEAMAEVTAEVTPVVEVVSTGGAAAAAAPATDPFANMSPEDADVHRKAQRFARLLIDEVKLYNQAKVAEGRKKKDLYDRLKEDVEKSRATYTKRYGNTVAASGDYLNAEIIRSLAGDDASVLGPNFHK